MKANEAPEKLYIALSEFTEDGRTFVLDHRTDYPICTEYIRTDAFIEKAWEYLMEYEFNDSPTIIDRMKRFETFKIYMEGV